MKKLICAVLALALTLPLLACGQESGTDTTTLPPETSSTPTEPSMPEDTTPTTEQTEPPTQPSTEPEEVVVLPAQQITEGFRCLRDGEDLSPTLTDGNIRHREMIYPHNTFVVESQTPFAHIYLEWDYLPGPYTLSWEGGSVTAGESGFLHEYIPLPEAVTSLEFTFQEESIKTLSCVKLYTEGATPEGVQIWSQPCEEADILVFPTHSDDDALFFGALMAYYAIERGLKVQTAFMVEHTNQPYRVHERLNGLWEMGIRNYPILYNAPDTGTHDFTEALSWYSMSDIPGWQVELIRRFKPLVVVGHDLNGEYGNAGHKVNAYYLVRAIEYAADPEYDPESAEKYGTWNTPKLYLHLYPENEWYFDVNAPMANDPQGRTPFEVAEAGYACHLSQHQWGFKVQQDDNLRIYDCRPFGLYRSLVGEDTTADVMENIDPAQWRNQP